MWMYLIPVVVIVGIFVVFYLFKDKFMAKGLKSYEEATNLWSDKDAYVKEIFSNPDMFKLIQDAIGEAGIECMCPAEPKKGIGKKLLKGATEVLTSRQSFDMALYYLVVAGGELHMLCSNGEMITSHDAWTLSNLRKVDIRPENAANKVMGAFSANDGTAASKESVFFTSNGEDYSFRLLDIFHGFAKFSVEKGYSDGKYGHNPFYRTFPADNTYYGVLTGFYGPETIAKFRETILALKQG